MTKIQLEKEKMNNYNYKQLWAALDDASPVFHAPLDNDKLGDIPAFNLLPVVTCSAAARKNCMINGCYAVKFGLRFGWMIQKDYCLRNLAENTKLAMTDILKLELELENYFASKKPEFFRIHASGDFFSVEYAKMWARVAARHPGTKFLAFTKQFDIVRAVEFSAVINFELVLSGLTGVKIPNDLREKYRCAWCDDGTENRIPKDAIKCPGSCEKCTVCWHLRELNKDTVFHKH